LRSAITVAGVALAVAALTSLLAFERGYQRGMDSELGRLGAHVLVVPKGCPYDAASIALHGANWPCFLRAEYLAEVRAVPQVAVAAPVFMNAFPSTNGTHAVFLGVTPEILALKPGWRIEGRFPRADDELLAGAETARRQGWRVGQSVRIPELAGTSLVVAGILGPTQGADDTFVFLPLAASQRAFRHERELTHVLVKLHDPESLDDAVARLRGCNAGMDMNVVPLTHLFRTIRTLVNSTRLWLGCVAVVAMLVAATGVGNAVLMAVAERTREIGTLRAIGASSRDIFRLFWIESLQLCVLGGAVGIAVALAASTLVESWLRARLPFAPTDALVRVEPGIALATLAGTAVLGAFAGLLPAWRAARLEPIVAMRSPGNSR
jgi:putative ABC transport system permease protein